METCKSVLAHCAQCIQSHIVNTFEALCPAQTSSSQNFCQHGIYAGLPGWQLQLERLL